MPTPSTSIFALDRSHPAKSDPSLIADDDQRFAIIRHTIDTSIRDLTSRLDACRMAPGGKGQQALDRDLEIHEGSARLRVLERYRRDVCLGRFVADDGTITYVGRVGLIDQDGNQLVADWRSPLAEPFFAATRAHPDGIRSRRRYRWSGGHIVDYWDEMFDDSASIGAALDDDSAFIASLGASRSPQMRDVLGTLAADQDAIIRAGSRGALVVDGGPGTGKTVVALHRAAYLLYADPRLKGNRGGVLVVGPHNRYLAYVSDVLPSLGEATVQMCTLREMVTEGFAATVETDRTVARLKSTIGMVDAIDTAVRWYEEKPAAPTPVETPWMDTVLSVTDWAEAFDVVDPGAPHNEARDAAWEELVLLLHARHGHEVSADDLRSSLSRNEALAATFNRAWPILQPTDLVADLWSVPAFLRLCAPWLSRDEVATLQRDYPYAWTDADLPLLDAARRRLGDPQFSVRRRRRDAVMATEHERMNQVVDDLLHADDDGEGVVTMLRKDDFREMLDDDSVVESGDPDVLAGPFAHVIVDEAQELTDAQWRMLLSRNPSASLTIVGDRAQAREGFAEGWSERLTRVGIRQSRISTLTINYRTPDEVMTEAAPGIRAALPDANVPKSVRSNGLPVMHRPVSELGGIVGTWLDDNVEGTVCVIGDASFAERPRVRSLSPVSAKGLEFDLVVLVNPGQFGEGVQGAVDRYVSMTRATRQLVVLTG